MDDISKLDFLGSLQKTGIVPGLDRMSALMDRLGSPQLQYPVVIVAGTNGKGSTTCLIDSILRAAGYRTGRFTSPHLVDVRERIFIDGGMIDAATFEGLGKRLACVMESENLKATFFEAVSAIGFMAFAQSGLDVAVVEVGMGGRLDSTNVTEPMVSVLTNVGLDHTGFLGDSVEQIAFEKVGVARGGRPFVTGVDDRLFDSVIGSELARIGAKPVRSGKDFSCTLESDGFRYLGRSGQLSKIICGLPGSYQADNLGLALAAVECLSEDAGLAVGHEAVLRGAATAFWPGRFQKVASCPSVILDGCHNVHAAVALSRELDKLSRPLVIVHASRPEKDYHGVLSLLAPAADVMVETSFYGGEDPDVLALVAGEYTGPGVPVHVIADPASGVARAVEMAGRNGTVLVTGSLYMIGSLISERVFESEKTDM